MSVIWHKVLRDLWGNRRRTLLVTLSIAISIFISSTVAHMAWLSAQHMQTTYEAAHSADITFVTAGLFDQSFTRSIRTVPGVSETDARRRLQMRFRLQDEAEWHPIQIFVPQNPTDIRINKIYPEADFGPAPHLWPQPAVWPPPDKQIVVERTSLVLAALGIGQRAGQGDAIVLEPRLADERTVPLAGVSYDPSIPPATFAATVYGYATQRTLAWLGEPAGYNQLLVRVQNPVDTEHVSQIVREIKDRFDASGIVVVQIDRARLGELPLSGQLVGLTAILGVLSTFSVVLSVSLIVNTVSSLLARQIKQVGIMKSIGATSLRIAGVYVVMMVALGLLALPIAIPLALATANQSVNVLAYFINFKAGAFVVPDAIIAFECGLAIGLPVLASLKAVHSASRLTVREAISATGVGETQAESQPVFDRLIRIFPRPVIIGIRNTFKNTRRLVLTLGTLSLAGAIFIAVMSLNQSLNTTLAAFVKSWQFDFQMQFGGVYSQRQLLRAAEGVAQVQRAEGSLTVAANRQRPDGSLGDSVSLIGVLPQTNLLNLKLSEGRWLLPNEPNAVVIGTPILAKEPDVRVGDTLVLLLGERKTTWQVVGVTEILGSAPYIYADMAHIETASQMIDRINGLMVQATPGADVAATSAAVETVLKRQNVQIASTQFTSQLVSAGSAVFGAIVVVLGLLSIMFAAVGAMGLAGTMSIAVMERTREIGVMRAIGAKDDQISNIFVIEGLVVAWVSWVVALPLAWPISQLLVSSVSTQFLQFPVALQFSVMGVLIWLGLIMFIAWIATSISAKDANQITIRQSLAYE